jgi:hypothetical protein
VVVDCWRSAQSVLGVFLMKTILLAGVAALSVLSASAAHAVECPDKRPVCIKRAKNKDETCLRCGTDRNKEALPNEGAFCIDRLEDGTRARVCAGGRDQCEQMLRRLSRDLPKHEFERLTGESYKFWQCVNDRDAGK